MSSGDERMNSLNPKYFTKDFDPVLHIFDSLQDIDDGDVNDYLRSQVEEMDLVMDVVTAKLADHIQENYEDMVQGMRQVQEVDMDMTRALIHVKNARRMFATTNNALIRSNMKVVVIHRKKERAEELSKNLNKIVNLRKLEAAMKQAAFEKEFSTAVSLWTEAVTKLKEQDVTCFTSLRKLQYRMYGAATDLRQSIDQSLSHMPLEFDSNIYSKALSAYILLDKFKGSNSELNLTIGNGLDIVPEFIKSSSEREIRVRIRSVLASNISTHLSDDDDDDDTDSISNHRASKSGTDLLGDSADSTSKLDVHELLALMSPRQMVTSIIQCYYELADLLHSNYLLRQWHRDPFSPQNSDTTYSHRPGSDSNENSSHLQHLQLTQREEGMIRMKLREVSVSLKMAGMELWDNMQKIISNLLNHIRIDETVPLEHFVRLLNATYDFVDVGEEFGSIVAHNLRGCVKLKCKQYLEAAHRHFIELNRMFLDTEDWRRIQLPSQYCQDIIGLIEKRAGLGSDDLRPGKFSDRHVLQRRTSSHGVGLLGVLKDRQGSESFSIFSHWPQYGNPFSVASKWSEAQRAFNVSPVHATAAERGSRKPNSQHPSLQRLFASMEIERAAAVKSTAFSDWVVTTATLSGFATTAGKYVKMMEQLQPVTGDVLVYLGQLSDLFIYVVFTLFASEEMKRTVVAETSKLSVVHILPPDRLKSVRSVVRRVKQSLANCSNTLATTSLQKGTQALDLSIVLPLLTPETSPPDISSSGGLVARIVAAESLQFLVEVMRALRLKIEELLPASQQDMCAILYQENVTAVQEVRKCIYRCIGTHLIQADSIPSLVEAVNWMTDMFPESQNGYVITIVQRCGDMWGHLHATKHEAVSTAMLDELWTETLYAVSEYLVEGISRVNKCSAEGRALMLKDIAALFTGLNMVNEKESSASTKSRSYVEQYVRAFYYNDSDLIQWVRDNSLEYSRHHMEGLIRSRTTERASSRGDQRDLLSKVQSLYNAIAHLEGRAA